jgi:hypothetical protein
MLSSEKKRKNSGTTIFAASFQHISRSATARIEALLEVKKARITLSTTSKAVKILSGKHYAK